MPFANQDWPATRRASCGSWPRCPAQQRLAVHPIWREALYMKASASFFPLRLHDQARLRQQQDGRCPAACKPRPEHQQREQRQQRVRFESADHAVVQRLDASSGLASRCRTSSQRPQCSPAHTASSLNYLYWLFETYALPSSTEARSHRDGATRHFLWNSHVQATHQRSSRKCRTRSRSDDRYRRRRTNGRTLLRRQRAGVAGGDARRRLSRGIPDGCPPTCRRTHTPAKPFAQIALAFKEFVSRFFLLTCRVPDGLRHVFARASVCLLPSGRLFYSANFPCLTVWPSLRLLRSADGQPVVYARTPLAIPLREGAFQGEM